MMQTEDENRKDLYPSPRMPLRQCGGTGTVTVYAEKDFQHQYPEHKVCPQCQGSGRVWLSGTVIKQIEPYAEPEP